jgi:glycosyltransferase involved in cell wall biosynthesis
MLFSIILPTYNREKFIPTAIESVLNQSYKHWELIIIDNASSDNTKEVVRRYSDTRIKYRKFDEFLPIHQNWERSLEFITGEYFIILGDDDYFLKDLLLIQAEELEKHNKPCFSVTNSASYTQFDPVGNIKNLLFCYEYDYKTHLINPMDVSLSYQTYNVYSHSFNASQLHPSVFFIKKTIMQEIKSKYGSFYNAFFPDWIAHVLLGLYAKYAIFINQPLVIIGGFDNKHYCYSNSKDSFFAIKLLTSDEKNKILMLPSELDGLKSFFNSYGSYPYFSGKIITQLLLNYALILNRDEHAFYKLVSESVKLNELVLDRLYKDLLVNYSFCRQVGDEKIQFFDKKLTDKGFDRLEFKASLRNNLNKFFFFKGPFFLLKPYIVFINSLKTKVKWAYIRSGQLKECERVIKKITR